MPIDQITSASIENASIAQVDLATGVAGTGPAFSAYQSSAQSVTNNTFTKVSLQTEEFDTNNNFDSTTNFRFTPTVAGYYQVSGSFNPQVATGLNILSIYKNGARFKDFSAADVSGNGGSVNGSALVFLNGSTDYVELYCYQLSGGTATLSTGVTATYFQASMVRAA
jgi:hypothetical protein